MKREDRRLSYVRDGLLDLSKGVAIILVVLGHTFQGQSLDFDDSYGFRFIYSFHMPLFALLAGASASFWVKGFCELESTRLVINVAASRIWRSAVRLWLPFFSWTLIGYWAHGGSGTMMLWLWEVIQKPDYSLWFLPCIFWCIVFLVFPVAVLSIFRIRFHWAVDGFLVNFYPKVIFTLLILFLWRLTLPHLPVQGGLAFANYFHRGLFFFFLLGFAFFRWIEDLRKPCLRAIPYLIFFSLVPFWYRTMPNSLAAGAPALLTETWFGNYYSLVVAISGSLVFIDIAKILRLVGGQLVNRALAGIGMASLEIYAVHFYFLNYFPPVLSPILISLLVFWTTALALPVRKILFGR